MRSMVVAVLGFALGAVVATGFYTSKSLQSECPQAPKVTTDYNATDGSVKRCITIPGAPGINGGGGGGAAVMCYTTKTGGSFGVEH